MCGELLFGLLSYRLDWTICVTAIRTLHHRIDTNIVLRVLDQSILFGELKMTMQSVADWSMESMSKKVGHLGKVDVTIEKT